VLVTLALAIVTGAGLLTAIVWTAITGLRLGALICLIMTVVLLIASLLVTALAAGRTVTTDHFLAGTRGPKLSAERIRVHRARLAADRRIGCR
jgi:hypothetical protein